MALQNNKSLGQHWLTSRVILNEIAYLALKSKNPLLEPHMTSPEVIEATSDKSLSQDPTLCLEIGPGLGTLTSSLLKLFKEVLAVEFDPKLANNLPRSFPGKNLTVINQDFLKFDLSSIKKPYVVVANIPYYITSPIITKLLNSPLKPSRIVLLIQKEVAIRINAGKGDHTFLSISVQNLAQVGLGPVVGRELFTPPPKVDSQVLILDPKPSPTISVQAIKLAKLGFSSPRKKLIKNLPYSREILEKSFASLGFHENIRPSELSLEDWQELYDHLQNSSTSVKMTKTA